MRLVIPRPKPNVSVAKCVFLVCDTMRGDVVGFMWGVLFNARRASMRRRAHKRFLETDRSAMQPRAHVTS